MAICALGHISDDVKPLFDNHDFLRRAFRPIIWGFKEKLHTFKVIDTYKGIQLPWCSQLGARFLLLWTLHAF